MKFKNLTENSKLKLMSFFAEKGYVYRFLAGEWVKDFNPHFHPMEQYHTKCNTK